MAKLWSVFVVTVLVTCSEGRTVDGGRNDAEILKVQHPLAGGIMKLPLIKAEHENDLPLGLNDIQGGLMDKGDNDVAEVVTTAVTTTTQHTPTVPEHNDIASLDHVVENTPDEVTEEHRMEDDNFDEDIFQNEGDLVVIMRRMYEALTRRLNVLKSRVTSVEQTAGDVFARLTVLDCADLLARGKKESTVYTFHMDHNGKRPVTVFCDMETDGGGWTVIQRRLQHAHATDFNRGWYDYKMGFGNASSDYWIGLENIYILTNTRHYEMRIDLTDFEGESAYAQYDRFHIENEAQGYRLHISGYSGTAGDALGNEGKPDNFTADGMMFTTHDEDHDTSHEINCAKYWKIGGWWFNRCSWANLNGPYKESGDGIGINWHMWRNKEYLRSSSIMIRPARNL
ncbi:techylectin-5A-like [Homarus americanus]|uniref:Techylectin-5A-like 1 n=1 Tax=Homarus americanus TaxID=6706 RepID=A0A8J5MJW2_HOMAM|nr:techylectin-5A-like [Homarus americanus]KAG7153905.1 techylectin-5A-like 1 [Homarus americanus]